jgi:hypothetical protein
MTFMVKLAERSGLQPGCAPYHNNLYERYVMAARDHSTPTKTCTKCGETKPVSDFYLATAGRGDKHGRRTPCKQCQQKHAQPRPYGTAHDLSLGRLREVLDYDPETGAFAWKAHKIEAWNGKVAGFVSVKGHKRICVDNKIYHAHVLAWLHVYGEWALNQIDHINGNGLDNRIENLRLADNFQNSWNKKKAANNTSGVKGVSWHKPSQKWVARITVFGRVMSLGSFDDVEDAKRARVAAEKEYFGEYRRDNP